MTKDVPARLRRIMQTAESGRWPKPEDIDILRDAHEQSLELGRRYEGRPPLLEVPEPLRSEIRNWAEQGQLIARALHALAVLAGLSIQETTELVGGSPVAWSRLRANAAMAQSKGGKAKAADEDEGVVWQGKQFPGCNQWSNWGFGLDENGNWHLFFRRRADRAGEQTRWLRNLQVSIQFARGSMTKLAKELTETGQITQARYDHLNPDVSKLRTRISKILEVAGYRPEGDPLPYDSENRLWRPIVRFGTAEQLESRHWNFQPSDGR
jgi:hypothetical protein